MAQHIPPRVVREDDATGWRRDRAASALIRCLILFGIAMIVSCRAPQPASTAGTPAATEFVGSAACESCHQDIYARWKDTLMANVIRDPARTRRPCWAISRRRIHS